MLLAIARKELQEIVRDRVCLAVLCIFVATLVASSVVSYQSWKKKDALQSSLQDRAREQWLSQSTSSAHQATHDGQTVYKRPTRLAVVDPGINHVLGTQIRLESHRRHDAIVATNRNRLNLFQLTFDTPALLIQAVLPLVAILLSYAVLARERERGTWKLLLTLNTKHRSIVFGKLIAVFTLVVLLASPVAVWLIWTLATGADDSVLPTGDLVGRTAAFAAVNMLYLFGWCATGVAISARCSAGAALVLLVACWATWTLIVPRAAFDLAYSQYPLPDRAERQEAREAAVRHGSDGQRTLDEFNARLERRLLKQYGVDDLRDLPIDINAARLLAMEEFTDAIDDEAESQIAAIYEKQNQLVDRFELASPYLAVRSLSMAFAGTDRRNHAAFLASAERYRRLYVKILNTAEMKGEGPGDTAASAREFWSRVPRFQQTAPSWFQLARSRAWPCCLLACWSLIMTIIALRPSKEAVA